MYTCTCDCICRPCVSIHAACLCVKGCLSLPSLCRASEGAALAAVRALHNLCAGNKKGQRHVVVAGGVDALLERLRHTYRQGMRRRGEAAAADSVLKEAADFHDSSSEGAEFGTPCVTVEKMRSAIGDKVAKRIEAGTSYYV